MMTRLLSWVACLGIFVLVSSTSTTTDKATGHVGADSVLYQLWMRRLQTAPPIRPLSTSSEPDEIQGHLQTQSSSHNEHNTTIPELIGPTEVESNTRTKLYVADGDGWSGNLTNTTFTMEIDEITLNNNSFISNPMNTPSTVANLIENFTKEDFPIHCLNISGRTTNFTEHVPANQTRSLCSEEDFQDDLDFQKACNESGINPLEGASNKVENELENTTRVGQGNLPPCAIGEGQDPLLVNATSGFEEYGQLRSSEQTTDEKAVTDELRNHKVRNMTNQESEPVQNSSMMTSQPMFTPRSDTVAKATLKPTSQHVTLYNSSSVKPQQNISVSKENNIIALRSSTAKPNQNISEQQSTYYQYNVSTQLPSSDRSNASMSPESQSNVQELPPYNFTTKQRSDTDTDLSVSQKEPPNVGQNNSQHLPDARNYQDISEREQPGGGHHQPSTPIESPSSSAVSERDDMQIQSTQTSFVQPDHSTQKPIDSGYMDRTPEFDPLTNRGGPFLRKPNAFDFLMMGQIATAQKTESQLEFREANFEASAMICGILNKKFCRLSIGGHCC